MTPLEAGAKADNRRTVKTMKHEDLLKAADALREEVSRLSDDERCELEESARAFMTKSRIEAVRRS